MSFLRLQAIHKSYGTVTALDGINLDVGEGSRTAIVGPSASGKTTLLRTIAGFEFPDKGRVTMDGQTLADGPAAMPAHRRHIGFVAQDGALFPHLSVGANVGFGLDITGIERSDRIAELLAMVGLDRSLVDRRPDQLSGGQQQRVAIARALAQRPRLMLLDEPFSALDSGLRSATRKAVTAVLASAGITTILVTHDQAEALSFADQVVVLQEGRLAQAGTPRDLYLRPRTVAVAIYLGDAIVFEAAIANGMASTPLGLIPIDTKTAKPTAMIMLRPEQIRIEPAPEPGAAAVGGTRGRIIDSDFGGAVCTITIELAAGSGSAGGTKLVVRSTDADVPVAGTAVRLWVKGTAHVFTDA